MTWLDGGAAGCGVPESCNLNGLNVKISNIQYTPGIAPSTCTGGGGGSGDCAGSTCSWG